MKKLLLSAFAIVGLTLTSCSDFLEADNKSNINTDTYFTTEEGFENYSIYPYYLLRNIYGGTPNLFCSGTDLYEQGRSNYSSTALSLYKDLNAGNGDVLSFYQNCFKGIQECWGVIEYGASAAGKNVDLRVDEAKALMAFYYYLLTQQIGGVPILDHNIKGVELSFPKKSQKEVYEFAINLLKEVEANGKLPADDNTGRVSMRAVYNFLAKLYLAYAWDNNTTSNEDGSNVQITSTEYFKLAAQYADKAIGGKTPSLSFSDMWNLANDNNTDIIFAVQYHDGIAGQDATKDGNQQQAQFGNYYNDADENNSSELTKYTNSQFPASEKLIYLFEPGDERFDGTFMVEHYDQYKNFYDANKRDTYIRYYYPAWYTDLSNLTNYNTSAANHEKTTIYSSSDPCYYVQTSINKRTGKITYTTGNQRYSTSRTSTMQSLCVRKFDDYTTARNGTSAVSFHNIVLAHLTETYLIAAEAYHMAGDDATSLARLNVVRERAKATALTSYASYIRHYSDGTAKSVNLGSGIGDVPYVTNLDPIDVILDERARELCGEYYRWMDLRRTKRLISYNIEFASGVTSIEQFRGPDGKLKWFRPFPQDEIYANEALTNADQNPGYVTLAVE